MPLLKELLDRRLAVDFVGREEELALLLETLHQDGPLVVYLHGIAGAGKSTLLDAFTRRARTAGATVIRLDCQAIEPTETGLLSELALATGGASGSPQTVAARLGQVGTRVIVALDTYEAFRLMDSWLRQVLIPLLPDNVRLILCGREGPVTAWLSAPGWHGLFKAVRLDSLDQRSALELLSRAGVPPEEAKRLQRICHGHPLALTLAASLQGSDGTSTLNVDVGQQIVEKLSRLYIADIKDLQTRRALEAASVIRRVTVPLLAAMLPDLSPQDTQERIRALPFVQADRHGLRIHDAVREAVALTLRAENPQQYREYRRAACSRFMSELRTASASGIWCCTADLLYLLENPVVREAFFPTGTQEYVLEPAQSRDEQPILEIINRHEAPSGMTTGPLTKWWTRAPETFVVTRDPKGVVVGFYCAFDTSRFPARLLREDPVTRVWMEHLDREPVPRPQRALFLRWLTAETGEAPSPVQAACWVDLKRKYLELRPNLRRVYLTVQDLTPYAAVAETLGFQVLRGGDAPPPSRGTILMLDFGPSSVDGWLARLAAAELGFDDNGLLDCAARELVLEGRRISLSKLEFGVMEYLQRHVGEAVPRIALLENVWEQSYDGGSNVVDVVIRALRKKLADNASVIETVQGVGYRLCREQALRSR
jgi:hypothetical protein